MLINRKGKKCSWKKFKSLKKTKWGVKSFLKAIVSINGASRITDNVIDLPWVMASWKSKWNLTWRKKIKNIDCVLPLGFRDWVPKELQRVGCVELLNTVQRRVRPKLHVFGGIHEGKSQKGTHSMDVITQDPVNRGALWQNWESLSSGFQPFQQWNPFLKWNIWRNLCTWK